MLDSTGHKFTSAARVESYIFDLERQTVHDLPIDDDMLGGPIHYHDGLQIVTCETLIKVECK